MQFFSMTALVSMRSNVVSDNECCRDSDLSSCRNQQIAMAVAVAIVFMGVIIALVASAFVADGESQDVIDCDHSVTSETTSAVVAFTLGWAVCLVLKCHRNLANPVYNMVCSAKQVRAFVCRSLSSLRLAASSWLAYQGARLFKVLPLAMVGILCAGCVTFLFVSAFTAVPDDEPTEDGFASESSPTMRAFTVGWMFMLSFKLRRELVGVVGPSCFLHPF